MELDNDLINVPEGCFGQANNFAQKQSTLVIKKRLLALLLKYFK